MTERLTRDRIIELLRELPEDATIDDAIEKLVFVAQIERGIARRDARRGADESVEALLRRIRSADVHFERGVPVFPRRPGAPTLSIEDVDPPGLSSADILRAYPRSVNRFAPFE